MDSGANSVLGLLGLWMWLQLVAFLAFLLGGMYALYCLGKAAAGMDRLASAVEELMARQGAPVQTVAPGPVPPSRGVAAPAPYVTAAPAPYVTAAPAPSPPSSAPPASPVGQSQPFTPDQAAAPAAYPQEASYEPTT